MIPVVPQPEPPEFEVKVRRRGKTYLERVPSPTTKDFETHAYWQGECLQWLCDAYGRICAYFALWIPPDVGSPTVDHFKSKVKHPLLAYEWSNYRLSSKTANERKGDAEDVLDPFNIGQNWFLLVFPGLEIIPNRELDDTTQQQVKRTIERLKLNDQKRLKSRAGWVERYCKGCPFELFRKDAPFIAHELERQGLVERIKEMWEGRIR